MFSNESVDVDQKSDQQASSDDQSQTQSEAQAALQQFWSKVMDEIKAITIVNISYLCIIIDNELIHSYVCRWI